MPMQNASPTILGSDTEDHWLEDHCIVGAWRTGIEDEVLLSRELRSIYRRKNGSTTLNCWSKFSLKDQPLMSVGLPSLIRVQNAAQHLRVVSTMLKTKFFIGQTMLCQLTLLSELRLKDFGFSFAILFMKNCPFLGRLNRTVLWSC